MTGEGQGDLCSRHDMMMMMMIKEGTVNEPLKLSKEYIVISEDKINIIKHCRKSILYHNEELKTKKSVIGNIDNPMRSLDGVKLSEFIGIYWYTTTITLLTPEKMVFTRMMV